MPKTMGTPTFASKRRRGTRPRWAQRPTTATRPLAPNVAAQVGAGSHEGGPQRIASALANSGSTSFRPFWMVGLEPAWCTFGHFNDDHLGDRRHESEAVEIRLSLVDVRDCGDKIPDERRFEPASLRANLVQRLTEAEPAVRFSRDVEGEDVWLTCSLGEADDLATKLIAAAERGEEPLSAAAAPEGAPFWQTIACPPWCRADHEAHDFYVDRTHMPDLSDDEMMRIDLTLERSGDGDRAEWLEVIS